MYNRYSVECKPAARALCRQVTQYWRFWVSLWDNQLLYFPAKLLSGPEDRHREAYRADPCKMMSVQGWMVFMCDTPEQPDAFQLTHPIKGTS